MKKATKPSYKFAFNKTKNGEWQWTVTHANGRQIAKSSETYKRKNDCSTALYRLLDGIQAHSYAFEA